MIQANIYDSPPDLGSFARTATITSITFGSGVFAVDFDKRTGPNRWPDVPFGPGGSLQYTLGLCLNINGQWDCSAAIQFWYGRDLGATMDIAHAWFYDSRWGPLQGQQPANGQQVGIFVGAGNMRNVTDHSCCIVLERSDVVLIPWGTNYSH